MQASSASARIFVDRYFAALAAFAPASELASFFHPDVVQEELPNALFPNGVRRTADDVMRAAERGRKVLRSQRYQVDRIVCEGEVIALEVTWSGVLAVSYGTLPAGAQLRARSGMFIELRDGRIARQRNYDCFDPIGSEQRR